MSIKESILEITGKKNHEAFVRLMMVETMVDFKEFVDSLKSMDQSEMMGAGLLMSVFADSSKSSKK